MPGHNYFGPGTHVEDRLNRGDQPVNIFDRAAMIHDVEYLTNQQFTADNNMFYNIIREKPEYLPAAVAIRLGFLVKDIYNYPQDVELNKYEKLKNKINKNYYLGEMKFADINY